MIDYPTEDEFERELALLKSEGIKDSPLRREYERKVRDLRIVEMRMREDKRSTHEIAVELHRMRRAIGEEYKKAAPSLFCEYIYWATQRKYGDPLGPDYETLSKTKTDEEIIESAVRPIADLDTRLTLGGFTEWFRSYRNKATMDRV